MADLPPSASTPLVSVPCARVTPHYSHEWMQDHGGGRATATPARCPGVRNRCDGWGPIRKPPYTPEDSPLPCRCYFVNGKRVTADCSVGHNRTWGTEEASALALAVLNAPEKTRTDALLSAMHTLILIASEDNADGRFARRQLAKIEDSVHPDYPPKDTL